MSNLARRCGTTLSVLIEANPSINIHMIRPGMVLNTRIGAPPQTSPPRPPQEAGRYVVRPGDTMFSIARAHGIPMTILLALNPQVDPRFLRPGDVLRVPGADPGQHRVEHVTVDPARGAPGSPVRLTGSGFERHASLQVLAGANPGSLRPVSRVQADWRGRVDVELRVPEWARREQTIVFALAGPGQRVRTVSAPFRIVSRRAERPGSVAITGTLIHGGAECQLMRGDDGRTYSLLGDLRGYRPGDRVDVDGRVAEVSFCMQGTAVEVRRIRDAS